MVLRNVVKIIDKILAIIPDGEVKLKDEIQNYKDSLFNQAPEMLLSSYCWNPFQNILSDNILTFEEEWQKKVLKIFNNE